MPNASFLLTIISSYTCSYPWTSWTPWHSGTSWTAWAKRGHAGVLQVLDILHGQKGARGLPGRPGGGVSYTRWGKSSCPGGISLVYAGRITGSHDNHDGGGVDMLCLSNAPQHLRYTPGIQMRKKLPVWSSVSDRRTIFSRYWSILWC